jgi:cytochrome c oxidase cbb3-type subunit 3
MALDGIRRWRLAAVAAVGLVLAATWAVADHVYAAGLLGRNPDAPLSASLQATTLRRGAHVFHARCESCHGQDGRGGAMSAGPSLADGDWLYGDGAVSQIEQTVAYGIRSEHPKGWNLAVMPAYGHPDPHGREKVPPLGKGEIDDVISFLETQRGLPADPLASGRGKVLFEGRAGCFDCHGADAHGDPAIGAPNLTDDVWLYGDGRRDGVFVSIFHGRHGVMPAFTGQLSAADLRAVSVYVHGLSKARRPLAKEPG